MRYNAYYVLSDATWAQTVSHELGGHHDAWHELVAKVGASQAWTDYYDLDYFAERWATTLRQAAFCRGHQKVMADAITRARPRQTMRAGIAVPRDASPVTARHRRKGRSPSTKRLASSALDRA